MRSRREMFRRRPRRHWRLLWMLALVVMVAIAAWAWQSAKPATTARGLGQELSWRRIDQLPPWAREVLQQHVIAPEYQLVAALVDLNRDEQFEILVGPAPPRPDLFIADIRLHSVYFEADRWRAVAAPLSCRPPRLGSFLTDGYWDLPCRDAAGTHVLRWRDGQYTAN